MQGLWGIFKQKNLPAVYIAQPLLNIPFREGPRPNRNSLPFDAFDGAVDCRVRSVWRALSLPP